MSAPECALCEHPLGPRAWWTTDHRYVCEDWQCELQARERGIVVDGSLKVATAPVVRP